MLHTLLGVQMDIEWQASVSCEYPAIWVGFLGTTEVITLLPVLPWVYLCASYYGNFHKTLQVLLYHSPA